MQDQTETVDIPTLAQVRQALRVYASPAQAVVLQRFFKTGPGEYGEGDRFLGVNVPQTRKVARTAARLPLPALAEMLQSPLHEERLLALLAIVRRFERGTEDEQRALFDFYLSQTARINNWDLVDVTAPNIVGAHLVARSRRPLYRLARSPNLWERRIAIVATHAFIRRGDCADTLAIAETLLADPHDLIHKAVGWMLREVGKRDTAGLEGFLARHAGRMPRTMLRYAIERLPVAQRSAWLAVRGAPSRDG